MFGIKTILGGFGSAVTSVTPGKPDIASVLGLLDKVPGLPAQQVSKDTLDSSLAVIQLGTATLLFTFDDANRTNVRLVRMDAISNTDANALTGENKFSTYMLSEAENKHAPVYMTVNRANFARNHTKITSDAIVRAIMIPVENIPLLGASLKDMAQGPLVRTCDYLIDTLYTTATGLIASNDGPAPKQ